jgi:hypothetical protein
MSQPEILNTLNQTYWSNQSATRDTINLLNDAIEQLEQNVQRVTASTAREIMLIAIRQLQQVRFNLRASPI